MESTQLLKEATISELVTPSMANFSGYLHGGELLKMADRAAYVCAHRHSREYAVTAVFDRVVFHAPVHVGDMVTFFARIVGVGRTSMQVEIRVIAENLKTGSVEKVSTCLATMVAMKDGKKVDVPPLACNSIEDHRNCIRAFHRRELSFEYNRKIGELEKQINNMNGEEILQKYNKIMDDM
jgi:acyl-CoA hydrolase